eukprot:578439-Hanusia_phi.AAC.1
MSATLAGRHRLNFVASSGSLVLDLRGRRGTDWDLRVCMRGSTWLSSLLVGFCRMKSRRNSLQLWRSPSVACQGEGRDGGRDGEDEAKEGRRGQGEASSTGSDEVPMLELLEDSLELGDCEDRLESLVQGEKRTRRRQRE